MTPAQPPHITIRAAHVGDMRRIYDLLLLLHEESPHAPLHHLKLMEGIEQALQGGVVMLSCTQQGLPVGTLALDYECPWFSEQMWLIDRWMFVHPQHRRTPHATALIRAAIALADEQKLPLQMAVTDNGRRTAGKIRLFSRMLGEPTGAVWHRRQG